MKAYKLEILVLDFENAGIEDIKTLLENTKYINVQVKNYEVRDIGEWHDEHPLNNKNTAESEYYKLFKTKQINRIDIVPFSS